MKLGQPLVQLDLLILSENKKEIYGYDKSRSRDSFVGFETYLDPSDD